jgi:hypothetical protein
VNPRHVSAVIVTRGDVDLNPIMDSLRPVGFREIVVWSNARPYYARPHTEPGDRILVAATDLAVYGRYAAIERCRSDFVFVQDDDCLVDAAAVLDAADGLYDPTTTILANMPASRWPDYPDSCLVGWGAVFHRDLPPLAWGRFASPTGDFPSDAFWKAIGEQPEPFRRECDVVFTTLTPHVKIDVGFQHLPWAEDPERAMFLRPWRQAERDQMYALARQARDLTRPPEAT